MALFTDGPLNSTADLQKYENGILGVASVEAIDLGAKIALAQDEIANQLLRFLMRRTPLRDGLDVQWTLRRRRDVSDVVVTDPLRRWHAQKALAMVYRDAYNNQLNDRYQGKWAEYEQLAKVSSPKLFSNWCGRCCGSLFESRGSDFIHGARHRVGGNVLCCGHVGQSGRARGHCERYRPDHDF